MKAFCVKSNFTETTLRKIIKSLLATKYKIRGYEMSFNKLMNKDLGLDDFFKFGKYKGEQVEDILTDDPDYIDWLIEEGVVDFDEEVLELVSKKG